MVLKKECNPQTRLGGEMLSLQNPRRAVENQVQKNGAARQERFSCGSEIRSRTKKTPDRIKGWETKPMSRLFRFKREKDERWF